MTRIEDVYSKWQQLLPLNPQDQKRLNRKFELDFNYNSNHIEGNTLTYGQTEVLLMLGEVVGSAKMKDLEDMKAHALCLQLMKQEAATDNPLTETFIRQLHHTMLREDYTVYKQLPGGDTTSYVVHAGTYKTRPNSVITRTGERFEYASPQETPGLMYDLVSWYNEEAEKKELTPIQLAALFHYRYIRIHPFEDGNGRIARLMVNFILYRNKLPMLVVLSKKKNAYLTALGKVDKVVGLIPSDGAHTSFDDAQPFIKYMEDLHKTQILQDITFISAPAEQTWWYDGEIVTFRSENTSKILCILKSNPRSTISDLTVAIGINKSAVQKQLNTLLDKGYIVRDGKPAIWHVIILPTI